ncbi:hypothetical protein LRS05_06635 [Flavobacterium sp. J372]|uniref:hypothetical protein n=1 Tax=Flavobacterium sp. J372 TaxID=2898436 RepID=UPI002151B1C3|nr:hypothetical protein [Flavobacterium sp. J372]MCR5861834.1 hypothetical protein [Flavobacterium sp. J372]
MNFNFQSSLPGNYVDTPIVISGEKSLQLKGVEYLVIDDVEEVYEIRYEAHTGPFRDAIIHENVLAVGHEEHFYLFDIVAKRCLLTIHLSGYFGNLFMHQHEFYICDANGIRCVDLSGSVIWNNDRLAIDGIFITEFTSNQILGEAEIDPPGGWKDFVLSLQVN